VPWDSTVTLMAAAVVGILAGTSIGGRLRAEELTRAFGVFLVVVAVFVLYTNRGVLTDFVARPQGAL
jgi:uncharacterized membrane protein YfcA